MPRSGKLPVLNLLTGQKSGFFANRCTDSCQTWHVGPLSCAKFHLNRHRGWECGPKISKISTFWYIVVPRGWLPWPISKTFRGFYTSNYPLLVFQISCDSRNMLRSYWWETARPSIRPNFSVHPVGKAMRWIKKWMSRSLMGTTSSITMKSLGKIAQCAPAICAKIWCFLFFVVAHSPSPKHRAFEGSIVRTSITLPFIARF